MQVVRFLALSALVLILGCSQPAKQNLRSEGLVGPDYRYRGPESFVIVDGSVISDTGCTVTYTLYQPSHDATECLVVLGHGFMRSKTRMDRLARHLASWGIKVVAVEFCNSQWWKGNHDRNGADMVAVAGRLHAPEVIYSGFSAGGLAAIVAATMDPKAKGYLGLDMVDSGGLGKNTAPHLEIPVYGLLAEPSSCNAHNNGIHSYALARRAIVLKVEDSSHCHFEFPVDRKCSFFCGRGEKRFSREEIQKTILGLTTAGLLWQMGVDNHAENWWIEGGHNHKALVNAGYIKSVQQSPEIP